MTVSNELLQCFCLLLARCTILVQQMFECLKLCRGSESQASSTSNDSNAYYFTIILDRMFMIWLSALILKPEALSFTSKSVV